MTFNKKILKNGLRVITVPMADNPSVTVLIMVEAGSKYETKKQNGLSHFLEHMVFKGTPTRPHASDISRELDALGAHYNAFTSQEVTGYYAKVAAAEVDTALDIVSDLFLNPLFESAEIEKEKGVIIEEIRMYADMPQRDVHEVLNALLYGDQPAGWSVLGPEVNIRSFGREDFLSYRKEQYVSGASTVIVAGSFDEKKVLKQIDKMFGSLPAQTKKDKVPVKEQQDKPAIEIKFKETDQTHMAIGIRTFSIFDDRNPVMNVLTTILGKGMSSRLFSKLRDDLGICYYVRAEHTPYTDHGDFTISAGVDTSRIDEAIKCILAECRRLRDELVPAHELKKAKDHIAGTTMLELETSEARAEYYGFQEILKREIETPEAIITKVQAVTAADVQKLAQEIFVDKNLNMAIVGKFDSIERFQDYFAFGA